ncbi:aminopeptidase O [Macaca thibetana thibetana]|uniref:aminopeptidase O n=1 Tax=Macaca thibetana thibetana TaxID=257877 RepID=UPI0021BC5F00|nr:aminopeptidase O [Macaca thibetana thibetana]
MDMQLDPAGDDLPLMANTSHILVKHYVLDLDVDFESQVIEGTIVLFLEDGDRFKKQNRSVEEACQSESNKGCKLGMPEPCHVPVTNAMTFSSEMEYNDCAICSKGEKDTSDKDGNHDNQEHAAGISSSKRCCDTGNHGSEEFLLVLDCCDLSVLKVEEVDVAAVPGMEKFTRSPELTVVSEELRNQIVRELVTLPANRWREQLDYYARCSQAAGCGELLFDTDTWSLQIRKTGAQTTTDFPHAIRIWYKTKPEGRSVTWTSDQSGRPCVYTVGSPVNNRALFPCQEPPVAMSTWQATVRAAASFVVLMSGENSAKPTQRWEGCSSWYYYVTMPMPASTFTIAVGCWTEVKMEPCSSGDSATETPFSPPEADFRHVGVCSHMEYPCRFQNASATTQQIIPHRVFAPVCLTGACQETLLQLIPPCLSAAHSVLGTHPFSRLDVLIVPANFPSLGMASPHIMFLSQSILTGGSHLCGTRLCHEIAHAWFGLALGARDWTEEWLSEGFASHLEDVFWAAAQQLAPHEAREQQELRACLRWRRLQDEMQSSPAEMQVLRPNKDKTGHTSDSGASVIKHGLNPEKIFMQVHYLKGYFLLRFLAERLGDETYFSFLRKFVHAFHGQLILSQDFLQMLLENIPEEKSSEGLETIDTQSHAIGCGSAPGNSQPEGRATCCSSYPGGPDSGPGFSTEAGSPPRECGYAGLAVLAGLLQCCPPDPSPARHIHVGPSCCLLRKRSAGSAVPQSLLDKGRARKNNSVRQKDSDVARASPLAGDRRDAARASPLAGDRRDAAPIEVVRDKRVMFYWWVSIHRSQGPFVFAQEGSPCANSNNSKIEDVKLLAALSGTTRDHPPRQQPAVTAHTVSALNGILAHSRLSVRRYLLFHQPAFVHALRSLARFLLPLLRVHHNLSYVFLSYPSHAVPPHPRKQVSSLEEVLSSQFLAKSSQQRQRGGERRWEMSRQDGNLSGHLGIEIRKILAGDSRRLAPPSSALCLLHEVEAGREDTPWRARGWVSLRPASPPSGHLPLPGGHLPLPGAPSGHWGTSARRRGARSRRKLHWDTREVAFPPRKPRGPGFRPQERARLAAGGVPSPPPPPPACGGRPGPLSLPGSRSRGAGPGEGGGAGGAGAGRPEPGSGSGSTSGNRSGRGRGRTPVAGRTIRRRRGAGDLREAAAACGPGRAQGAGSGAPALSSPAAGEPLQRERRAGAECGLARQVRAEVTKWIRVNRRPRKRKRREREAVFEKLLPDQLVLLLEHLLEQKTLSHRTLQSLQRTYHLQDQDAEVRHRWCELIVKHKFTKAYESVERFLQEDQAMGVYLYGELMVSEDARQQQLARRCFERTREQMDRSSAQVVADMLF